MDCKDVQEKLSAYYDGELSASDLDEMDRHLCECAGCSEELESYSQLSILMSRCSQTKILPWETIAARLDDCQAVSPVAGKLFAVPISYIWVATLAATILLAIGLSLSNRDANLSHEDHGASHDSGIAIDYSKLIQGYSSQPMLAAESLVKQFDGKEVPANDAESMLGFKPWVARSLPSNTRLISTHVLKLPECHCEAGKCTCGPKGCNCAVGRCQRSDGSEFLVVEHCKSQGTTFGDLPSHVTKSAGNDLRLIGRNPLLAVSWTTDNRQLTAIGLKDQREAELLASANLGH